MFYVSLLEQSITSPRQNLPSDEKSITHFSDRFGDSALSGPQTLFDLKSKIIFFRTW